jgi:hypothetical protein
MKKRAETRIRDMSARIAEQKPLMECGVCWRDYDPAEGDPVWRIEPRGASRRNFEPRLDDERVIANRGNGHARATASAVPTPMAAR